MLGGRGAEGKFVLNIISLKLPYVLLIMPFFILEQMGGGGRGGNLKTSVLILQM